jgi:hypothetical protein
MDATTDKFFRAKNHVLQKMKKNTNVDQKSLLPVPNLIKTYRIVIYGLAKWTFVFDTNQYFHHCLIFHPDMHISLAAKRLTVTSTLAY